MNPEEFFGLYQQFDGPLMPGDCGERCSPHNEKCIPFCCDTRHAIPTAYDSEWGFLQANTDLWHRYQSSDTKHLKELRLQLPDGQVLIECLGHHPLGPDLGHAVHYGQRHVPLGGEEVIEAALLNPRRVADLLHPHAAVASVVEEV